MNKKQRYSAQRMRQEAAFIEKEVAEERRIKRYSQARKKALGKAWSNLTLHAYKLGFSSNLSHWYDPEEYLTKAADLVKQLERLEGGWQIQPEESFVIAYKEFRAHYDLNKAQVDECIEQLRKHYPEMPLINRSVEWFFLEQQELQLLTGEKVHA